MIFMYIYVFFVFMIHSSQNGEKDPRVKHYQIRQKERGEFYLAENYLFSTIPKLIHYHQHNAAGRCASFSRREVKKITSRRRLNKPYQMLSIENTFVFYLLDRSDNTLATPCIS